MAGEQHLERSASDEALLALILEAFAVARRSGKDDWDKMYAGPLKNRILKLRGGRMGEPDWESTPFTKLLERFPETLRVDFGQTPPMVELLAEGRTEATTASPLPEEQADHYDVTAISAEDDSRAWRIRTDLWDAVMGIRSPDVFLWRDGAAVRVPADEAECDPHAPRLPTLSGAELDDWQAEFAAELAGDDRYTSLLQKWGSGAAPTSTLPRHLQHLWYARLKTLVRDRIEAWFRQADIPPPRDVVQILDDSQSSRGRGSSPLRVFVERCVAAMTEDELAELRIPAAVTMRLQR